MVYRLRFWPLDFRLPNIAWGKTISLIRLEVPNDMLARLGMESAEVDAFATSLEQVRETWQDRLATPHFFGWPERLHGAYQSEREASELGRIFGIANGMHDEIDAVVVVGSSRALAGIRALVHACCDPLHNELNRAQRGSKPRVYFAGDSLDNDTLSSLLQRLKTPAIDAAPNRFAVIAISDDGADSTQAVVLAHMLDALEKILGNESQRLLGRYFIPFARRGSWLQALAASAGCKEIFEVEFDVAEPDAALALANHLPAAFLGLDCMRWLGGAFEMNQHFLSVPFSRNSVLQYVAVNRARSIDGDGRSHSLNIWSDALESWGHWYHATVPDCSAVHVHPQGREVQNAHADESLILNVAVNTPRTDQLSTPQRFAIDRISPVNSACSEKHEEGRSMNLVVPVIDTFSMGQLFQMVMIAVEVDRQWSPDSQ